MKDKFSDQSKAYARFRPQYPPEMFSQILKYVIKRENAWDCGTGNGQVAGVLAGYFQNVYATDISPQQLNEAVVKPNIRYSRQPAEKTDFINDQFDLIIVAQAIHWFNFDGFYNEAKRTLRPGGIMAVTGYGVMKTIPTVQRVIDRFYTETVGPYWDAERHYIDEGYRTIPFPFEEIPIPDLHMEYEWTWEEVTGYISTWSAAKQHIRQTGTDPLMLVYDELKTAWGSAQKHTFRFPLLLRIGR